MLLSVWRLQAAEAFLQHYEVGRVRASEAHSIAASATLLFEASVAPELELIFCRGPEWESGVAHVFALAPTPGHMLGPDARRAGADAAGPSSSGGGHGAGQPQREPGAAGEGGASAGSDAGAETYLRQMAAVAQSSLAGAVQATCGRLRRREHAHARSPAQECPHGCRTSGGCASVWRVPA